LSDCRLRTTTLTIREFINRMDFIQLSSCFANDNRMTPHPIYILKTNVNQMDCHLIVILFCKYNLITKNHFSRGTLRIKFLYKGTERKYGGKGRICPSLVYTCLGLGATSPQIWAQLQLYAYFIVKMLVGQKFFSRTLHYSFVSKLLNTLT